MTTAEVDQLLERFDLTDPQIQRGIVARLVSDRAALVIALDELVKVAVGRGDMLNMRESEDRNKSYATTQEWLDHLADLGKIPPTKADP